MLIKQWEALHLPYWSASQLHLAVFDADVIVLHGVALIFHAVAVAQAETLLFQRAGNPQLTLMFSDDPAGEHAGLEERVDIADGKDLFVVARAENGNLLMT